jgi:dienelactone hydrolase
MTTTQRQIRALYTAQTIPGLEAPYNTLHLKVYYPALYTGSPEQRNSGQLPADNNAAPYPVFIMMPGINTAPESYAWLAKHLAENGIIAVTYSLIVSELGYVSLGPGLDIDALRPEYFGKKPVCVSLNPILEKLAELNANGELKNLLDLDNIILGGHSGGGSAALYSANPQWHRGVKAAISYGAHTGTTTLLGWPQDTLLPLNHNNPVLIMGGNQDGVIAASSFRYSASEAGEDTPKPSDSYQRLERTFNESIHDNEQHNHLIIIDGANHSTICDPADTCTGRHFLDWPETSPGNELRSLMAELSVNFIYGSVLGNSEQQKKFKHLSATNNAIFLVKHR